MIEPKLIFAVGADAFKKMESDEMAWSLDWEVPKALPYFDGHFPGNPVLPAVAVIDASVEFLRRALQLENIELKAIHSAKFVSIIAPGMPVRIDVKSQTLSHSGKSWNVVWNAPAIGSENSRLLAELSFSV